MCRIVAHQSQTVRIGDPRRRMRYAIHYTNVDVLASVVSGRSWRRYVPPMLFLLALATLCAALARPHVHTLVGSERATVILVVDVSRSMEATDVKQLLLDAIFIDHKSKT